MMLGRFCINTYSNQAFRPQGIVDSPRSPEIASYCTVYGEALRCCFSSLWDDFRAPCDYLA
jgi:hypothetical protein